MARLYISRSAFYRLVKAGRLEIRKIGASSYVTEAELARFINALPRVGGQG